MTNATQVIEAINNLSADEREIVTEFVLKKQSDDVFVLTPEEIAEIDRRSALDQKTYSLEEVFSKYGL